VIVKLYAFPASVPRVAKCGPLYPKPTLRGLLSLLDGKGMPQICAKFWSFFLDFLLSIALFIAIAMQLDTSGKTSSDGKSPRSFLSFLQSIYYRNIRAFRLGTRQAER
jgi:hypothetical protein